MKKDDTVYLHHILDSIRLIQKHTNEIDYETFLNDELVYNTVIRQLEIIGEASNHISDNVIYDIPDIPWKDIVSMRNILVHDYFEIDLQDVWKTAKNDLIILKEKIQIYLNQKK